jgi:hypothetical protein
VVRADVAAWAPPPAAAAAAAAGAGAAAVAQGQSQVAAQGRSQAGGLCAARCLHCWAHPVLPGALVQLEAAAQATATVAAVAAPKQSHHRHLGTREGLLASAAVGAGGAAGVVDRQAGSCEQQVGPARQTCPDLHPA